MDRVGIVGYGAMGRAFARRIRRTAGLVPVVFDVDDRARRSADGDGLVVASSARELGANCDVVDVIVRTDGETIDATVGDSGAAADAEPGLVILLHSSILPATTLRIEREVAPNGVEVADACASGTPSDIDEDRLVFLLGANPELAARVTPHLLRMARTVLHVGPVGAGNVAKLMKNLINASERLVVWEALQIGEAAGIGYVTALEMLQSLAADHQRIVDRWPEAFDPSGADLLPWCGTNLYEKDIPLAAALGRSLGLDLPLTEQLATTAAALVRLNEGRTWPPK